VVAFAEVPETDVVEVVQADGAGDGVEEVEADEGRGGREEDVREINADEVGLCEDGGVVGVADDDLRPCVSFLGGSKD
jgi:hypothetical protein